MPYANYHEAFTTYTESVNDTSTLDSIKNPFHISTTDPADDIPRIANNFTSDGYNTIYASNNQWDIVDTNEIRGNQSATNSPDVTIISQNRRLGDRLWDRETSADVDNAKRAFDLANPTSDINDIRVTTGGSTSIPADTNLGNVSGLDGSPVGIGGLATGSMCSDDECVRLMNHSMGCDNCLNKFKKVLGLSENNGNDLLGGIKLPEINVTRMIFWVVMVILIVAVYELLNRMFRRLF